MSGLGADPLPAMFASIDVLVNAGCGVIVVPCNTSHHWHADFSKYSPVPVLHIAEACVAVVGCARTTAIQGTSGCLQSGFFQRTIAAQGGFCHVPDDQTVQPADDAAVAAVKGGDLAGGARYLDLLCFNRTRLANMSRYCFGAVKNCFFDISGAPGAISGGFSCPQANRYARY